MIKTLPVLNLAIAILLLQPASANASEAGPTTTATTDNFTLFARVKKDHAKLHNGFNRFFVQADKPYQFLGEPSVAQLDMPGKDKNFDYFLLAIPFNVPMIKKNLPFHYRYVRLDGRLKVVSKFDPPPAKAKTWALKILSIYPTNSVVDATMQSTHTLEETIQPQWSGFSAGSIHNANTNVLSYPLQLPTMAGITAPYCAENGQSSGALAEIRWTVYPAKKQEIIVGNRLGLALVAVPKFPDGQDDTRKFWFNGTLSYALTLGPPFSTSRYEETWEFPIKNAGTLKQLLAAHALDFPSDDLAKNLKAVFDRSPADAKYSVTRISPNDAALFDANSGDVQEIKQDGLTALPSYSKRWETKDATALITAYDKANKTVSCRCTVRLPIAARTPAIQKMITLSDSKNQVAPKAISLYCTSRTTRPELGQELVVYEGDAVLTDSDDFDKYDTWQP